MCVGVYVHVYDFYGYYSPVVVVQMFETLSPSPFSLSLSFCLPLRPEGKKYEMAVEWGVQIVNSLFLADIIHNGQPGPSDLRYTQLNLPNEFSSESSSGASRLLG